MCVFAFCKKRVRLWLFLIPVSFLTDSQALATHGWWCWELAYRSRGVNLSREAWFSSLEYVSMYVRVCGSWAWACGRCTQTKEQIRHDKTMIGGNKTLAIIYNNIICKYIYYICNYCVYILIIILLPCTYKKGAWPMYMYVQCTYVRTIAKVSLALSVSPSLDMHHASWLFISALATKPWEMTHTYVTQQ